MDEECYQLSDNGGSNIAMRMSRRTELSESLFRTFARDVLADIIAAIKKREIQ